MAVQVGGSSPRYDSDAKLGDGEVRRGWLGLGYAISSGGEARGDIHLGLQSERCRNGKRLSKKGASMSNDFDIGKIKDVSAQ